jgi:hypothetical protein
LPQVLAAFEHGDDRGLDAAKTRDALGLVGDEAERRRLGGQAAPAVGGGKPPKLGEEVHLASVHGRR